MPKKNITIDVTPEVAKKGIYIDFEGLGRKRDQSLQMPCFIGVLEEDGFSQVFFDSRFKPALSGRNPQLRPTARRITSNLDDYIEELIDKCRNGDRRLFAYSIAEENLLREFCRPRIFDRLMTDNLLVNAKINPIKLWRNKIHGGKKPEPEKLETYLKMIDYKFPQDLLDTPAQPARTIRRMDSALRNAKRWSKLTDNLKQAWARLLLYNYHDCKGLKRLTIKAANGLKTR